MIRRRHLAVVLLGSTVVVAAAVPATTAAAQSSLSRPAVSVLPAKLPLGTVAGRITSPHRLKHVAIVVWVRETATDGSKGWVQNDDQFANDGYGLALNTKTGSYSFKIRPGIYRFEFNGTYTSGASWGTVPYGPGKPAAAEFGKSVKVRKGKTSKHVNIDAVGDFASIKEPDPGPALSPTEPTAGGSETVSLGAWPKGTRFTFTWQIGTSQRFYSFNKSIHIPSSAAGKSISVDIYARAYGKNGSGVSISTAISK